MTDFRAKYKQKGLTFGDPERSRISRAGERDERRKEIRALNFSKLRPLSEVEKTGTPGPSDAKNSRNEKLLKWKQDKEMKKKTQKKVVKPPFKVGVVHHRAFSPPINSSSVPTCSHSQPHPNVKSRIKQPLKGITRVTEKRLAAKAAAQAAAKAAEKKSFAPANYKFKAPAGLPNLPLFGRVKKGSIDASKFSWNLCAEKVPAVKSEVRESLSSQRRKSSIVRRESSRRSKNFKTNPKEERMDSNSSVEDKPCLSKSDKERISVSSIDSVSLRVSSDDAEVFDPPDAESSKISVDMQKKESTLKEVILTSTKPNDKISSLKGKKKKSSARLRFLSPTEKSSESSLEENNDSALEVNSSQEKDTKPEKKISPLTGKKKKSSAKTRFLPPTEKSSESSLEENNDSALEVNSSQEKDTKPEKKISPLIGKKKKSSAKTRFLSPTEKSSESSLDENSDPVLEVNSSQEKDTKSEKKMSPLKGKKKKSSARARFLSPKEKNSEPSLEENNDPAMDVNSLQEKDTKPEDKISPLKGEKKSTAKKSFLSPTEKNSEPILEESNDPVLQVNSLQEKDTKDEVNSVEKTNEAPEMHPQTEAEKMDSSSLSLGDKTLDESFPAFFSPYVVTRRGKKEARKEQQIRRGLGQHSLEEIPTKDTIMQNLNISIDEEKRTSQYFRCLIESETKRLEELCDFWTNVVSTQNPPEEAQYIVQQAVGQTRLLLGKKFKRFEGLVQDCEKGNGQMLVTCKDLQGFWDIVNMEVKNCEDRFQKLEKLQARGWIEEEEVQKPVPKKLVKKKSPKKKSPKKAAAKSSLRAMILAARQKKKEIEEKEGKPGDAEVSEIWKDVVKNSPSKVASANRKSSNTPQRLTTNERRTSFPLAVMAISQKCKTPEDQAPKSRISLGSQLESEMETYGDEDLILNVHVRLDESISYINSRQTPGKSILKRIKTENTSDGSDDSRTRSIQKVIFNDKVELNEVEADEDTSTQANLAAALARIDSLEFEAEFVPEMEIRAERKLNFEDESFSEAMSDSPKEDAVFNVEESVYQSLVLPKFRLIPPTPKSPRISMRRKFEKIELENSTLEKTTLEETIVEDEETTFTRTLRNRKVISSMSPRSAKKFKDIAESANRVKTPKTNRKNSNIENDKSEEKDETLNLNGSLKQPSKSSNKILKSPKLVVKSSGRKPKKQATSPPKENQNNNEEASPKKTERTGNVSPPKERKLSRQKSLQRNEETKSSEGQEGSGDQKDQASPVVRFVKMAARKTSLLYNMMKSPKSATKRTKEISKSLEDMRLDSDTESVNTPAKMRRSVLKRGKSLKGSFDQERKAKFEEEISKEFQEMHVDENLKSEKKSSLSKLFGTPKDSSTRRRKKNAKGANKSSVDEANLDNSTSSTMNSIQVNGERKRKHSTVENCTDSDVENNAVKRRNSRKHRSTGNILKEQDANDKDSKGLNLSLKESKVPKLRRSERIPESEVPSEKENETPSKRKSIRKSMSCHMAECAMGDGSSHKIQRSKSSGLMKTPTARRTLNLISFD